MLSFRPQDARPCSPEHLSRAIENHAISPGAEAALGRSHDCAAEGMGKEAVSSTGLDGVAAPDHRGEMVCVQWGDNTGTRISQVLCFWQNPQKALIGLRKGVCGHHRRT